MSEHFEGHGDKWEALLGDALEIRRLVPQVIQHGNSLQGCHGTSRWSSAELVLLLWPQESPIQAAVLLVKPKEASRFELWSAYPVLEGLPNEVIIRQTHVWSNNLEGEVEGHRAELGPPLSFFSPYFFRDHRSFTPNARLTVNLAALAYKLRLAEKMETPVEGVPYGLLLQEFLAANPGKDASDFAPKPISWQGARIMLPSHYACEYQFRCPVLHVERIEFFARTIFQLRVQFVGEDHELVEGMLYVPESILEGYVPKAGDDVEGEYWMTGYLP